MASRNEKENLKKLIIEMRDGRSQRTFGELTGISYATIQRIESWYEDDAGHDPSFVTQRTLERVAKYKKWSIDELENYLSTGNRPQRPFDKLLSVIDEINEDQLIILLETATKRCKSLLNVK